MGAGDHSGSSSCDMWQLQPPDGCACPTLSLDRTLCCHSLRSALRRRPRQQGRRLAPHWRRVSAGFWRLHPVRTRRRDRLAAGHFAGGVSDRCNDHFATCWCHAVARVYRSGRSSSDADALSMQRQRNQESNQQGQRASLRVDWRQSVHSIFSTARSSHRLASPVHPTRSQTARNGCVHVTRPRC
jgi:hypothetical protein